MNKTRAELETENAGQRAEIEALRDLIAAAAECADVPVARSADLGKDDQLAWYRACSVHTWLRIDDVTRPDTIAVFARNLREQTAARPVTYKANQPEPAQDDI